MNQSLSVESPGAVRWRGIGWVAAVLVLLPVGHPVLRPFLGPPSHLLWFAHVLPVALVAYLWGARAGVIAVAVSVLGVLAGEATFGAGYGIPADAATVAALGAAVGATEVLVAAFAAWIREVERERGELERVAATALDQAPEGVFLVDAERRVVYANSKANELFCGGETPLVGRRLEEFAGAGGQEAIRLDPDQATYHQTVACTVAGRSFPADLRGSPIPLPEEGTSRWLVTVRDRSEDLRREESERRSRQLHELGALVASVAHELNNPLTSVATYSELLMEEAERLPEDVQDAIRGLSHEGLQAAQIARQLLQRLRGRDSDRLPLDLNGVVRRALRSRARQFAAHGVTVGAQLCDEALPIVGSATELQEVVVNLFTNAEQAMHAAQGGGTLTVTTQPSADRVELVVEDDGPGIPVEVLPRIFEPFFTTKGGGGTGIGLALARRIAQAHGGSLDAANREARGARFTLRLPARASAAVEPDTEVAGGRRFRAGTVSGPVRVLVVDDQLEIRRSLRRVLERRGFQVAAVAGLPAARAALSATTFDVVLCDVHMPSGSGFDLYDELRGLPADRRPAFVLMTGDVVSSDVEQFVQARGVPHLAKPFDVTALIRVIEAAPRVRDASRRDRPSGAARGGWIT